MNGSSWSHMITISFTGCLGVNYSSVQYEVYGNEYFDVLRVRNEYRSKGNSVTKLTRCLINARTF